MPQPRRHRAVHSQPRERGGQHAASPPKFSGMHLEGPFISKARRGVHPAGLDRAAFDRNSREISRGRRRAGQILTVAPELPGALELIRGCRRPMASWSPSGHTDADYEQARAAIQAGARHAVHVYNAMRPFTHRDPGVIGAILTDPEVTAEIIADGVHVAGPAIQVLLGHQGIRYGAAGERRHRRDGNARRKLSASAVSK